MHIKEVARKNENAVLCRECGGYCCKASPCKYYPDDFGIPRTFEAILEKIHSGKATLMRFEEGTTRILTSRTRDSDGGVDIIRKEEWVLNGGKMPFLRECALLTPTGCSLSLAERPSGGALFVPHFVDGVRKCYLPNVVDFEAECLDGCYQRLLLELEYHLLAEMGKSPSLL